MFALIVFLAPIIKCTSAKRKQQSLIVDWLYALTLHYKKAGVAVNAAEHLFRGN